MTPRALIVDDSLTVRTELANAFRAGGFQVLLASTAAQARDLIRLEALDLLILAVLLPDGDGIDILREVRDSEAPDRERLAVVLLSSEAEVADRVRWMRMGPDEYLGQPYDLKHVLARAHQLVAVRRSAIAGTAPSAAPVPPIDEQRLRSQSEAAAARTATELAETRAHLVEQLERKNGELERAYRELQTAQSQLVQSAKMAALGELVAGIAHEINNPLAFVLSHLDTTRRSLAKAAPSPEHMTQTAKENWERALSRLSEMNLGLERIRELVVKLGAFSRLDEGEQKTVSIRECVESLLTILSHRLKDQIQIETHFGKPDQLECFPGLLTQAIMNLVSNSIDAIDGHGRIDIRTGEAHGSYQIVVTDSGQGIPPQIRERVMEPFFTTKPIGQGTGLGLSIAYSIVRKHGGTLALSDAVGGGTRAMILLPAKDPGGKLDDACSIDDERTSSARR